MTWLMLCALLALTGCAKHLGTITVINLTEQPIQGNFQDTAFTVKPGKAWWMDDITQGEHPITVGSESLQVAVTEQRTTVIDPSSAHCYVVADYRRQYGKQSTGEVAILEQFEKQKMFTPQHALLVPFGRALPKQIPEGSAANRLHQIDCALLPEKAQIAESIARIP